MIHYHGGPITPITASMTLWQGRHAMVSFANPEQMDLAAEICQSFALDNGAFSFWRKGDSIKAHKDWKQEGYIKLKEYAQWIGKWRGHPGFDWCLIPDSVDGGELENDALISAWFNIANVPIHESVPVWHLDESIERLQRLARVYHRIALGSSGPYSDPGSEKWWEVMGDAMDAICVGGVPAVRLHGLRMLNPTIFSQLPLSSADSCNVARNIGLDQKWTSSAYAPRSPSVRAMILADRIETHASASTWQRTNGTQCNLELVG